MKILFELDATKKQYKHNMFSGWSLKPDEERRQGTPTLVATRLNNGTRNYFFNDGDFRYHCMYCGWDFTAKNTYRRMGNKDISCPNCGFIHKSFNTHLTKTDGDELIPINWTLKIYQQSKTKIVFSFVYDYQYNPYENHNPENTEKFIFDLKENTAVWEKWKNRGWERNCYGKYIRKGENELLEHVDIGYTADYDEMHKKSVFASLKPHYDDDNKKSLHEALDTLKTIINNIKTKEQNQPKQKLSISGKNQENYLLDSLLNIAYKVRFWESPDLSFYGTSNPDIPRWFKNNWLNYDCNMQVDKDIEKIIRETSKSFYEAACQYFNIPDNPELKEHFSYRNIGLYKELENRYQNNKIVNLLFKYFHKLPGQCQKESYGVYCRENKMSSIMLSLKIFEQNSKKIMALPDTGIHEMVEKIQYTVKNISKLDPEYKNAVNNSRGYSANSINEYIIKYAEKALEKAIFEFKVRTEAEAERKNYFQKLAETINVPNTIMFRNYYNYEYISQIQTVFSKYNNNIANEFVKLFDQIYKEYHNNKNQKSTTRRINGLNRYIPSVYSKPLPEFLDNLIEFYDTFKPIFPKIITPAYTTKFISNNDNYAFDSLNMYKELNNENKDKFIQNKPRMKELHNYLCKLTNLQQYPDMEFEIPQDVINRFEMYCKNSKLKVLKNYSELLEIGNLLNNCSAHYRDKIGKTHLLTVLTDDLGKPIAEIEIKDNEIYQAKLINNRKVSDNPEINAEIIRFAKKTKLKINTSDICTEAVNSKPDSQKNNAAA